MISGKSSERGGRLTNCVNDAVRLYEGKIEISTRADKGPWSTAEAVVEMRLLPTPRVLIEVFDAPVTLSANLYNPGKVSTIRLPDGPSMSVRTNQIRIGETDASLLMPDRSPITSTRTGSELQSVTFYILNFPSLHQHDQPALLREGQWLLEIRPAKNLSAVKEAMKTEAGYGVTHEGTLRRSDGSCFPVKGAEAVLRALHHFLSFGRGGSCGIGGIVGTDESKEKAWEQWGFFSTYPWFGLSSWLDHRRNNHGELAQAFPGFMRAIGRGGYTVQDRVHTALYWYLRSNESNSPYSAIVLTQAAQERLSRDVLSDDDWKSLCAKVNAREALKIARDEAMKRLCVVRTLPACCKELRAANCRDGLTALANARNSLVHANADKGLSLEALLEAHNLGQWYTELLLLRAFDYRGEYANRLAYNYEGKWRPELVPWVR